MLISRSQHPISTIELTPGIYLQTVFPQEYIPALRSGFSLYPANPRWNALKFQAWKIGRQLRQAHDRGTLMVKSGDRTFLLSDCPASLTESRPDLELSRISIDDRARVYKDISGCEKLSVCAT
ncbi:MAG: hypothetical protein WBB29_00275 [Geitlerinemataceae cyanobacterium]